MAIIVCFEGWLAADPELTHTPNTGTSVCEAVVLINHRTKQEADGGEQWVDGEPTRYYLKAWRRRAEALGSLGEGASVVVVGHVETEPWTTDGGERSWRDTVVVDHLGETVRAAVAA